MTSNFGINVIQYCINSYLFCKHMMCQKFLYLRMPYSMLLLLLYVSKDDFEANRGDTAIFPPLLNNSFTFSYIMHANILIMV